MPDPFGCVKKRAKNDFYMGLTTLYRRFILNVIFENMLKKGCLWVGRIKNGL